MAKMRCVVCSKGPMDENSTTVYRINPKGQPGLYACEEHKLDADQAVVELAHTLERLNG